MVVVEDLHQPGDLVRLSAVRTRRADVAHVVRGAQQGQLLPAREGGVVAVGDRQDVVEGAVARALAELGRDQLVDDPVVEGVAGHRRRRRWPGPRRRSRRPRRVKRTMEKSLVPPPKSPTITVASAVSSAGEEEGRRHRLVGVADVGEAQAVEGGLVARTAPGAGSALAPAKFTGRPTMARGRLRQRRRRHGPAGAAGRPRAGPRSVAAAEDAVSWNSGLAA